MTRFRISALALLAAAACSKREPGPPAPPPPPAPAAPATSEMPVLSIAVDGGVRGWPLIVYARVLHPRALEKDAAPVVIPQWPEAIRLEVTGEAAWPFARAGQPEPTLTLDAETAGVAAWTLGPEATANLAERDYEIVATLQKARATARVRIAASGDGKRRVFANYHGLRGDRAAALAEAEGWVAESPSDVDALMLEADLLAADGRVREALKLYDRAIAACAGPHPRLELLRKRRALMNR